MNFARARAALLHTRKRSLSERERLHSSRDWSISVAAATSRLEVPALDSILVQEYAAYAGMAMCCRRAVLPAIVGV